MSMGRILMPPGSGEKPHIWIRFYTEQLDWSVYPLNHIVDGRCSCGKPDCKSAGKHPDGRLVHHGFKDATSDASTALEWLLQSPNMNIGIATGLRSNLIVIDEDPRNFHNGTNPMDELVDQVGPLPDTYTVCTGNYNGIRGHHYYFDAQGLSINSSQLLPGLEIKANKTGIVACPSLHMSGVRYELDRSRYGTRVVLARFPRELAELVAKNSAERSFSPLVSCSSSLVGNQVLVGNDQQVLVGNSKLTQGRLSEKDWHAGHLAYWRDWQFKEGASLIALQKMAGALHGFGASESEARHLTAQIVELAQKDGQWTCKRSPEDFIDCLVNFLLQLREKDKAGFGKTLLREVPVPAGLVCHLRSLTSPHERAFLFFVFVVSKWTQDNFVALPRKTVAPYLQLASLKLKTLSQAYEALDYLIKHAYNPRSQHCKVHLLGERLQGNHAKNPDRVPGMPTTPDKYKPLWPEVWLQGKLLPQHEVETEFGFPPLTGSSLQDIHASTGYGDRPRCVDPIESGKALLGVSAEPGSVKSDKTSGLEPMEGFVFNIGSCNGKHHDPCNFENRSVVQDV